MNHTTRPAILAASATDQPLRRNTLALAVMAALSAPGAIYAQNLPTGLTPTSGNFTSSTNAAGTAMNINQSTQNAAGTATSFSIGQGNRVDISQPNAQSVLMVNVLGNNVSSIRGSLTANGQFWLVNPAGVMFGANSSVDVGGLVASTMPLTAGTLDPNAVASGRYVFGGGAATGGIEVQVGATITALNGYVGLFAPQVQNNGLIVARMGTVALAAGNQVTLDMVGDGLIKVAVTESALNASVLNRGTIDSDGGNVLLTARSANALLDTVINTEGVIRANTISNRNGTIILDGGDKGVVSVAGTIEAKGNDAGTTGGTIKVLGENVGVALSGTTASVNASGDSGGGTILLGGNFQGKGTERNASRTIVGSGATVKADALTTGSGGRVIVWANDATIFTGAISARGGNTFGDGGFVEVSGKNYLAFRGTADRSAPHGKAGTLLLDPTDLTINAAGPDSAEFATCTFVSCASTTEDTSTLSTATLESALAGGDVNVNATAVGGSGAGTINWTDGAVDAGGSSLTLTGTSITFGGTLTNVENLTFAGTLLASTGSATSTGTGAITGIGAHTFTLTGAQTGTASGVTFTDFASADSTAVAGASGFNDSAKSNQGMTFASAISVTGTGAITNVNNNFADDTRVSTASGITYSAGFTTVSGTGTSVTGVAASFNDGTKVSGSGINYSGFATATVAGDGTADVAGSASFALTGPNAGTGASGINYSAFNTASNTTAVSGAVGFNDAAKSNQGITFASATTVAGTGAITNVNNNFADDTLVSTASGIDYSAGFTAVSGTGTAITGVAGAFDDTTRVSAASTVNYTGFGTTTVSGTGTSVTGVGASFNDGTKVSGSGINYSGLAGLATVAGDGTADVLNSASFTLTGPNAGTGASGINYSAFNAASNTTTVSGAVGFNDAAKSNQGITFASATAVNGTGAITNVNNNFADDTLVSTASGIDYSAGFTAVSGTGTAITGVAGAFDDTTKVSAASTVNYTGFGTTTVSGTGTSVTGVAGAFNDATKVSATTSINYSGLALATVSGTGTSVTGVAASFNDGTKVSGSGINYSGFATATVAGDGTADVAGSASFALTGPNAGTGASGINYSAFNTASNTTAVSGAVGFNDAAKSNQGITFASATTVAGTGAITNVNNNFADDTLVSTASGIDYSAGFTAVSGTGTAITGVAGAFDDTTRVSAASTVNYTGFGTTTVSGTGTSVTGVGASFNDGTKVSGSGINYSGLAGLATVAGDGTADVLNSASFTLTGPNAGTGASGINYSAFNAASNTTTVSGAVGFNDAAKSNQGITFASATAVNGTGAITNVNNNFADDTLVSTASGIDYSAGFTAVSGTGTAITGVAGAFDDTTKVSAASTVNYTGFGTTTVSGTGTSVTGVAGAFNDATKVSATTSINYSGLALATVSGTGTSVTGVAASFNDGTKVSGSGINYSGFATATVAGDGTADVAGSASFALTGPNAGTGASGINYSAFNTASNTTAVSGAVGFNDAAKSNQGITFASATTVAGTGAITNVNNNFADDTLVSTASGIDYSAGFTAVSGTGTAITGVAGAFDDTTRVSAASTVNYTGFGTTTVSGTGTSVTGVGASFNDGTKVSGSGINYSGLAGLATVAGDGTADVLNSASFTLTGPNAGTGASGINYSAFNAASNTTTVSGAVGFNDAAKSNQGITFASATAVNGTGAITNVNNNFADDTLVSTASGIDYSAGFTAVSGTGTAITGVAGAFDDTTKVSAASTVNYTGFGTTTVSGTGTSVTGVAGAFNDATKVSATTSINYSGLALATVSGTGTSVTGVAASFNDGTKVSGSGINYSGFATATVAGDGTADVAGSASFALTGPNAGTGASGINYSAFNTASNTTAVSGAVGFNDAAKSNQGITFASATTVAGTGAITNVNNNFADDTLVSTASGIDYSAGFTAVSGTGTAITGVAGAFDDTTRVSAASTVNYTGFGTTTVSGTGTSVTGVAGNFSLSTRISTASGIDYSGLSLATVAGTGGGTMIGTGQTYNLTGVNAGNNGTISWTSFSNLSDSAAGIFKFGNGASVGGSINAVGGTLDYSAGIVGPVTVDVTAKTGTGIGTTWNGITTVTGSAAADTISGSGATYTSFAGGTAGSFTAGGVAVTSFENIADTGAGVVNMSGATSGGGVTGNVSVVGGSVTLGAGTNVGGTVNTGGGTVNMGTSGAITGAVTTNTLSYAGYSTPVAFNVNTGVVTGGNIGGGGVVTGLVNIAGSSVVDSLTGSSASWTLSGANAGSAGGFNWSSFENITDTGSATISGNGSVAGNVNVTTNANLSGSLAVGGSLAIGGSTTMTNSQITSGGAQNYAGAVTAAGTTNSVQSGSGNITFGSTITGGTDFQIATGGTVTLGGAVSGMTNFYVTGSLPTAAEPNPFSDLRNIPMAGAIVSASNITSSSPTTGTITLSAANLSGLTGGTYTTGLLRMNGNTAPAANVITVDVTDLAISGTAPSWAFGGTVSSSTVQTPPGSNFSVTVGGASLKVSALESQANVAASTAAATAAAAAADEAANTFGTDSVAEQIEYGFAGDVGVLPPIDHRLQGVGISVPKCFNESREGESC